MQTPDETIEGAVLTRDETPKSFLATDLRHVRRPKKLTEPQGSLFDR